MSKEFPSGYGAKDNIGSYPHRDIHSSMSTNNQQLRNQIIKNKIKNRLNRIINDRVSQKKPENTQPWRKKSDLSVFEIVERHNMSTLRKKYMYYLERGLHHSQIETVHIRIGGAAKLHYHGLSLEEDIKESGGRESLPWKIGSTKHNKMHNRNLSDLNISDMYRNRECRVESCRVSPLKMEKRPFTAGIKQTKPSTAPTKSKEWQLVCRIPPKSEKPEEQLHVHQKYETHSRRHSISDPYALLKNKKPVVNPPLLVRMKSAQPANTFRKPQPGDIRPWELPEYEQLPM